jgi:hypothetical protein
VFDLSDHTLTQISTWAEVAILLFMVWEHYGPHLWTNAVTAVAKSRHQGFKSSLWENRTIIVAMIGLVIVVWLHWGRVETSLTDVEAQKSTIMKWLQQAERDRDEAKQGAAAAEAQKATLVEWLQTARHEANETKTKQDAQFLPEVTYSLGPAPAATAGQECVNLAHRLAYLNPKGADKAEIDHIRSTMTALGCGCGASQK